MLLWLQMCAGRQVMSESVSVLKIALDITYRYRISILLPKANAHETC